MRVCDLKEEQAKHLIWDIEKKTGFTVPVGNDAISRLNNLTENSAFAERLLEMGVRKQLNKGAVRIIYERMITGQKMSLNSSEICLIIEELFPKHCPQRMNKFLQRVFRNFFGLIIDYIDQRKFDQYAQSSIKHINGLKTISYGKNELIVICMIRNGGMYVKDFIEHYLSLGVKHIIFLDNHSEDDTVALASRYEQVTVLGLNAHLGHDLNVYRDIFFRQYLIKRFCKDRWCLIVDYDEFFDYPCSDKVKLHEFLGYLNKHSYTAVVAHLLDMFSDKPIDLLSELKDLPIKGEYKFYDISMVAKEDYFTEFFLLKKNSLPNKEIKFYTDGIRRQVFGTYNWLTKHPLILGDKVQYIHPHSVSNARCADLSAVCYHYKFAGDYLSIAKKYVDEKYAVWSEYAAIVSECQKNPQLVLKRETAHELYSVNDLVQNEFLNVSKQYMDFVHGIK